MKYLFFSLDLECWNLFGVKFYGWVIVLENNILSLKFCINFYILDLFKGIF